jgi:hypothetical protein
VITNKHNKKSIDNGVAHIENNFISGRAEYKLQKIDKNPSVSGKHGINIEIAGGFYHVLKRTYQAFTGYRPGNSETHIGKIIPPIRRKHVKQKKEYYGKRDH